MQPGTRLGPYEIVSRIGAGAMGEVWRARDTRLGRDVAVKVLSSELAHDARLRVRFEREAKTISQLNHPNICTLFDVGDDYIVMELLDGKSLAERLDQGPLPLSDVIRYGIQLAEALAKAHRESVIHRDLKPGNIMLTKSGVKLLDFGLARSTVIPAAEDGTTAKLPLTQEGVVVGTFQYMAPEQLAAEQTDARTDIFSLGAVLYEMTTGRPAFQGKTRTSLIGAIITGEPRPIRELQPLIPPALEHVIAKCLQKDPDDRWQRAADVAEELRWIGNAGSTVGEAAPVKRWRPKREALAWSIAVIAVLAAVGGGLLQWRNRPVAEPVRLSIPGTTSEYAQALLPVVSPDGRNILFYASARDGDTRLPALWVRSMVTGEARALAGTASTVQPFWSPDGRSIAFFREGKVVKLALAGSGAEVVAAGRGLAGGGSWGADGTILYSDLSGGIMRVRAEGGTAQSITKPAAAGEIHAHPHWLPDGRRFLFVAIATRGRRGQQHKLYVGDVETGEAKFLLGVGSRVEYAPPGFLLTVRDGILTAIPFDAKRLQVAGDPIPVASGVWYVANTALASFSVSATGVLTYAGSNLMDRVAWIDRGGTVPLIDSPQGCNGVRIAPDGRRAALSIFDAQAGSQDLWLYDLDRKTRTRLTLDPGDEDMPEWSSDGSQIIYSSDRDGLPNIYRKTLDGSREDELLVRSDQSAIVSPRQLSPDGRNVAYDALRGGNVDAMVQPLTPGAPPVAIADSAFHESNARISPDGRWISYQSNESGSNQIYVRGFPTGPKYRVSIDGGVGAKWKHDGSELVWFNGRSVMGADVRQGFENAVPRHLFEIPATVGGGDITPAADAVLMSYRDPTTPAEPIHVLMDWPAAVVQPR